MYVSNLQVLCSKGAELFPVCPRQVKIALGALAWTVTSQEGERPPQSPDSLVLELGTLIPGGADQDRNDVMMVPMEDGSEQYVSTDDLPKQHALANEENIPPRMSSVHPDKRSTISTINPCPG